MSQRIVTPWLNTNIPGAYTNTTVISNASGLATSGVVLIMGEAAGGPDYSITKLANNFFGPSALNTVRAIYTSGPIVDGFAALSAPSNDPDITGTASSIYIIKTNKGTHASALVDTNYGTLSDQNWGTGGNLYNFTVTDLESEVAPTLTGNAIPTLGAPLNGDTFSIRLNGGASTTVTLSGTAGDHDTVAHLVNELNQYTFTVTSANATIGATYTNNGQTFTVLATIAGGTTLKTTGTGAPSASGTLTKAVGTGDATITFSAESRLLPTGISASASVATPLTAIAFTMDADAQANHKGWGKSFELVDSTPGDLAALGFVPGMTVSSQEPAVEVAVIRTDTGVNEALNVSPNIALNVGYEGTTATMTINTTTLTTTVTGGTGGNLSIALSSYTTVGQLASFINSQPGYTASVGSASTSQPTSALDQVAAIGIASTNAVKPGRVKNSVFMFEQVMGTSTVLSFAPMAVAGLPNPSATAYLSGGLLGPTLATDIVNAIGQMAGIQVNIIVPLFSQNATADITAGNTDPGSTYTIDAINELMKSHCIEFSTPTLKKNRTCILSYNDTYANCKAQAESLASYRCSLAFQQVTQVNSSGVNQLFLPWYASCVAAGMQAGGFYKSICNHLANVVSFQDPTGYDSGDPDNVSDALTAGLLPLANNTSGILWVSDQSTYGLDTNFVYNSIQGVYLSDILSLDLAQTFQTAVVGKSVADISAASALSILQQRFDFYKKAKMVTTSNDAPLGYKNAAIQISAPSMFVQVEAKLTTSIYFVAIDLALSAVQQSAS